MYINLVYFVLKECDKTWNLDKTKITFDDLTFILEGQATYYIDDKEYIVNKGQFIYIPEGHYRRAHTSNMKCCAFNFKNNSQSFPIPLGTSTFSATVCNSFFSQISSEWLKKSLYYNIKCDALLMLLIHSLLAESTTSNRYVEEIKQYIAINYKSTITVSKIASHLSLNKIYCGNLFKKHTGTTILKYLNHLRLSIADQLIKEGISMTSASEQVGYSDLAYFCKLYKRYKSNPSLFISKKDLNHS